MQITEFILSEMAKQVELNALMERVNTLDSTVNLKHIPTDRFRWQDIYDDELTIYQEIATSQGLKPDDDNLVVIPEMQDYVVNQSYGGLLTVEAKNTDISVVAVLIDGLQRWTSDGLMENATVKKYFRVQFGQTIFITGSDRCTFTPAIPDAESPLMRVYTQMETEIAANRAAILDVEAGISNKTLSGVKTDIEAAAQGDGYIVNNALGGRITGRGVNALLVATGTVDVNHGGAITRVYNFVGAVTLLTPVPELVEDVEDGDIITSTGMSEIFFEPYISA